jgi:alpha-L-glutamate ligase-like protein
MKGLLYRWTALRQARVLGINQRNAEYILPRNPRSHYPRVDDKLLTKRLAQAAGLPTPQLLGVISYHHELRGLPHLLEKTADFVLKPARGTQGNGILVISGREGSHYRKSSGAMVRFEQLRQHVSNMISGAFSLRGDWDHCLIEARVILHPAFADVSRYGIPDVRVIVARGVPAMAMCRLPTSLSDGRANLHQGAIGAGVDMGTGKTVNAVMHDRLVTHHIDTNAPLAGFTVPAWDEVLSLAARASELSNLGYVGVDIVIDKNYGPLLLELNARPGLAIQVANKEGLLGRLRRIDALAQSELSNWTRRCAIARECFSLSASPQS